MRLFAGVVVGILLGSGSVRAQTLGLTEPLATVSFASGATTVDSGARDRLRQVATWMHDHPWRLAVVQAYSDRTGSRTANLTLSQTRADNVRAELIALGVDPHRIVDAAYGEDSPPSQRRVIVRGTIDDFRDLVVPTPPLPAAPPPAGT